MIVGRIPVIRSPRSIHRLAILAAKRTAARFDVSLAARTHVSRLLRRPRAPSGHIKLTVMTNGNIVVDQDVFQFGIIDFYDFIDNAVSQISEAYTTRYMYLASFYEDRSVLNRATRFFGAASSSTAIEGDRDRGNRRRNRVGVFERIAIRAVSIAVPIFRIFGFAARRGIR